MTTSIQTKGTHRDCSLSALLVSDQLTINGISHPDESYVRLSRYASSELIRA
jgi:hypothetical protein